MRGRPPLQLLDPVRVRFPAPSPLPVPVPVPVRTDVVALGRRPSRVGELRRGVDGPPGTRASSVDRGGSMRTLTLVVLFACAPGDGGVPGDYPGPPDETTDNVT